MSLGLLLGALPAQGKKPPAKTEPVAKGGAGKQEPKQPPAKNGTKLGDLKVAVVDLDRAINQHPLAARRRGMFLEWIRNERVRLAKIDRALQTKKAEGRILDPNSQKARLLRAEIRMLIFQIRDELETFKREQIARNNLITLEMRGLVVDAVGKLAAKKGIHLILWRKSKTEKAPLARQIQESDSQIVLYAAASLDITDDVIDYLKTLKIEAPDEGK